MDLRELCVFFEGTLFSDDYRGDFERIPVGIASSERSDTFKESIEEQAEVLLIKAIFATLSGNHSKSRITLNDLRTFDEALQERWTSRRKVYERFNLLHQLYPPGLRFRSNFGGSAGAIRDAEFAQLLSTPLPAGTSIDAMDSFERTLPINIYHFNLYYWAVQTQSPDYPRQELAATATVWLSRAHEAFPPGFIETASRLGLEQTSAHLIRLEHNCDIIRQPANSDAIFQDLYGRCSASHDLVGTAMCHVNKADSILSPPFSSPVALNLIAEGRLTGWIDEIWDHEEPKFRLKDNDLAQSHYTKALRLMKEANASRGCAAIHLRRGCIQLMEGILAKNQHRLDKKEELYAAAVKSFQDAEAGFVNDESNSQLTKCHQILLDISLGKGSDVKSRSSEIGQWGKLAENTAVSQFLGLLMMRFARRQYLDYSQIDLPLLCLSCALECFIASEDKVFGLQAILAEVELRYASGNQALAQVRMREARKQLGISLNYLRDLGKRNPSHEESLQGPLTNLLGSFHRVALRVYANAPDRNLLCEWQEGYEKDMRDIRTRRFFQLPTSMGFQSIIESQRSGPQTVSLDMNSLMQEQLENQGLSQEYNNTMEEAYAELEDANVERFDDLLTRFLELTESMRAPKDQVATFRLIAYSSLGELEKARLELPYTAPRFCGQEESQIERMLRLVNIGGVTINNARQIDSNQALRAVSLCFLSRDWVMGSEMLRRIDQIVPGYLDMDEVAKRGSDWQLATWVGTIHEYNGRYDIAFRWYLFALRAMETQRSETSDPDARRGAHSSIHGGELFAGLIRVCLKYADLSPTHPELRTPRDWALPASNWSEQAFIFQEQACARTLLDFLMAHKDFDPEVLENWAAYTYLQRQITDLINLPVSSMGGTAKKDLERQEKIQKELEELKEELVQYEEDGLEEKLSAVTKSILSATRFSISTASIFRAIPDDAVVIEIHISRGGLILFCITSSGIQSIHQSHTTVIEMRRLVLSYIRKAKDDKKLDEEATPKLATIANTISNEVLVPFEKMIRSKDHIIFVPSQDFNIFPFSALTLNGKPLFLEKAVSQVPSLTTLERLVQKHRPRKPPVISTIVNSHEPTGPGPYSHKELRAAIPMAAVGAVVISKTFNITPTDARYLEKSQFIEKYVNSDVILISTHGVRSEYSPWQSRINLKEEFRVMEVAKLSRRAALVVFGACMSGRGRVTVGNDILGFSHSILQSGAQTYMGALWNVNDMVTMLLLVAFFRKLEEERTTTSLAKCWQHAQKTVYYLTPETAAEMLKDLLREWDLAGDLAVKFSRNGRRNLERSIRDILNPNRQEKDFKHPYFWAPFIMVGYGGLCLWE